LAAPLASWALIVSFREQCHRILAVIAWLMLIPLGTGGVERLLLPIAAWSPAILPLGIIPLMVWQIVYVESRARSSEMHVCEPEGSLDGEKTYRAA
ncbi:MAG TPA: hypothetical protein DCM07_32105, partial [Planctomycetaceae bacterium]|nr:hypothetical protein [Planctomycetaceae bacterium]